jgi:hypothetical protein
MMNTVEGRSSVENDGAIVVDGRGVHVLGHEQWTYPPIAVAFSGFPLD